MKPKDRTIIRLAMMLAARTDSGEGERSYYHQEIDKLTADNERLRTMVNELDAQDVKQRKAMCEQADRIQTMQEAHRVSLANRGDLLVEAKRTIEKQQAEIERLHDIYGSPAERLYDIYGSPDPTEGTR